MYPCSVSPYKKVNTIPLGNRFFESKWFHFFQYLRSLTNNELKDFYHFIDSMREEFEKVRIGLTYQNLNASHHNGDDCFSAGWAGDGMLPIATYLYYLKSYGVTGKVLECGVFKGGSTCCLSHACAYLGLDLIAADSFEGLPDGDDYYGRGDFKGGFDEVCGNVERYGRSEVVTYLKGWFSESLSTFNEDLMLLWLDVDLKQSVIDVLTNTFSSLVDNGVIFCDGLGEHRDFDGEYLKPASSESAGIVEYFTDNNISYKAVYSGYGHMGLIVPHVRADEKLIYNKLQIDRVLFVRRKISHQLHLRR